MIQRISSDVDKGSGRYSAARFSSGPSLRQEPSRVKPMQSTEEVEGKRGEKKEEEEDGPGKRQHHPRTGLERKGKDK